MLKTHLARLPQIQTALTSLGGQVPGQALIPGQATNFLVTPQIQALQNLYTNQLNQVAPLKFLLETQKQIELQFANLNNVQRGQPIQGVGLAGTEAQNQGENAPTNANNIVLNLVSLLGMKLGQLSQLLGGQQNALTALSQCANALNASPTQYAPQLVMINGLKSEFANYLQNTPYQLTMCNNMISGLRKQLPSNLWNRIPQQALRNRFGLIRNIGSNLQFQTLNTNKNFALQSVNQFQLAQQQGQPVEFNLYTLASQPQPAQSLQQWLAENQVYAIIQSRVPQAQNLRTQLQSFIVQAANARPRLESYLIRAAQLSQLIPNAPAAKLAKYQLQLNQIKAQAANLQGEFNAAKNCAVALQVISECQNQLSQLASSPSGSFNLGSQQQPVSGLESQPGQNVGYPNQIKICILLRLLCGAQSQLMNGLQQGVTYQLGKAKAISLIPGY